MADFRFFINRQGPQGPKGEKGDQGEKGDSIIISDGTVTPTVYTLIFDRGDGNTFETQNIRAPLVDNGGTYVRFDRDNSTQYLGNPNYANLSGGYGEVKLATTTSVAQETVSDTDAVSYELFRQSGGGGGGTSFTPGTALELTNQNVLNVKIDGTTITTNSQGQLVTSGGGGGTSYTAADPIYIDNDVIKLYYDSSKGLALNNQSLAIRVDDSTIGFNSSGQLTLKATIPAAQIQSDWTQSNNTKVDFIKNKPTLGSLASKNTVDYTTDITNKPTLGSLASKNTVDYSIDITNKPTIGAGIITFTQGSTTLGTINVNQTTPTTINIPSSGGGGGSTYAAGNGIDISAANVISAKVDNSTIGFTAGGELELKATIPTDTGDLTNSAGYITSSALNGYATESWVANQGYITGISSGDIITALGYTPYSTSNPNGYITGITSSDVVTALGYTPYSSANPDGYTNNVGTVTSVNNSNPDSNGNVTLSIPAAQVQSDWNEVDSSSKAYILNKPTIPNTTNMVTTNTTQTISGTKTFSTETHFTGNLTFDSALGTPIIRGMSGANYRNMITRSNTYSTVTTGNTSDNLILKGALIRPKYSHDSSDGNDLALYSDIPGDMTGAGVSTAGAHGLVPAPAAGDNEKFLRGDGTWQTVSSGGTTYSAGQGINPNSLYYGTIDVYTDSYTLAFNNSNQLVVNTSNLGIPEYTSDLNNDSGFITGITSNDVINALGYIPGKRNIGEIITSTIPLTDAELHLLDGSLITGSGIYSDFVDYISDLYDSGNYSNIFTSEVNWQTSINTYGVCGKFVYDSSNNTVRLPKVTGFIEGTITQSNLGNVTEAGLPNITGDTGASGRLGASDVHQGNGAISTIITTETAAGYDTNLRAIKIDFDASRSSSIYGNSATVQPQAVKVLYYIAMANSTNTAVTVDINDIISDLNNKADVSLVNLSNGLANTICSTVPTTVSSASSSHPAVVVENYVNGDSWYRLYSDGWCEQGGKINFSQNYVQCNFPINLLKSYPNGTYTAFSWPVARGQYLGDDWHVVGARDPDRFWTSGSAGNALWFAMGYTT